MADPTVYLWKKNRHIVIFVANVENSLLFYDAESSIAEAVTHVENHFEIWITKKIDQVPWIFGRRPQILYKITQCAYGTSLIGIF